MLDIDFLKKRNDTERIKQLSKTVGWSYNNKNAAPIPLDVEIYSLPEMNSVLRRQVQVHEETFTDYSKNPPSIGKKFWMLN